MAVDISSPPAPSAWRFYRSYRPHRSDKSYFTIPARLRLVLLATALPLTVSAADLPPDQIEFFETNIRPILAESCYKCHSEKEGKSKGSLTLDTRAALLKGGATGPALIAGDPDKSLLIQAVRYADEDLQMPPTKDGGKLSPEKIAALEQWVKMGAPDPRTGPAQNPALDMARARQHWAFQPLQKPAIPATAQIVTRKSELVNPIDAFVAAKLAPAKLTPAPAADPRTLIRRLTYDLTGLPPTPAEVEAFVRDTKAGPAALDTAYEKLVDRLLASPRYGERWGRFWLDISRYADTKGYLAGNVERRYSFSYTYRDYVIRAFNEDKPFDQFIVEQLAADQLPLNEDKSALAAMGFLTLGRRFLNNQNDIIDDRIDVTTRGLLGLTVACARCHDHKFDPIPTRDYYALHGMFASSEEPEEKPLLRPIDEKSPDYQAFLVKKQAAEAKVKDREREEVSGFFTAQRAKVGDYLLGAHDAALNKPEKFDLFAGSRKLNPELLRRWQPWLEARTKQAEPDPIFGPWFALAAIPEKEFAEKAPALVQSWLPPKPPATPSSAPDGPVPASTAPAGSLAEWQAPPSPYSPLVTAALAEKPPASLKDAAAVYNRLFADTDKAWQALLNPEAAAAKPAMAAGKKAAKATSTPTTPEIVNHKSEIVNPSALPDPARESLRQILYAEGSPSALPYDEVAKMIKRQIDDKTSGLRRDVEALNWTEPGAPLRAMAMVDKPKPADSAIFLRGNPANRGPNAPRRFLEVLAAPSLNSQPSSLNSFTATKTSGRLELARAIASPANPLTARVFVNRVWGWHFGQSLVRTPSDFGVRTEAPLQRDLLDWLSASFVEGGWSVKKLQRLIVLSRTYRQSSDESPAGTAADPDNQLIHRFNRHRLEFEALRDTLLALSGDLDLTAGGRPDDLSATPFTHRRTIYGFVDRQNLPGMFRTFDFPNPDTSSSQRFATTVPQQALYMMNSAFAQKQARTLVARPDLQKLPTDDAKIKALYALVYQRAPEADELKLSLAYLRQSLAESAAPPPAIIPGWHYGYGGYDATAGRVRDFTVMAVRKTGKDARITPSTTFPDPKLGHVFLSPTGGHPGSSAAQAAIRRWVAPADGVLRLEGTLNHPATAGDGVHARIVSSQTGSLGEWTVHNTKQAITLSDLKVTAGETIDFVVDCGASPNTDAFTWAPKLTLTVDSDSSIRTWDAKRDFEVVETPSEPLKPWERLAQVLLLSNEVVFID